MSDFNPANWNWAMAKAAGRHAATYVAGGVTVAVAFHVLTPSQGAEISENINLVLDGFTKLATGIAGIAGVMLPVYTAWRAAHSASPSEQVKSVVTQLSAPEITQAANALADPSSRRNLIEAVAEMPEVKKVVPIDPAIAEEIPSLKVTKS
jgi:hypothetical protein